MTMSKERKQYLYKYHKEKVKRISLNVSPDKYEEIKTAADKAGESVNGYIKKSIDNRLKKE